MQHIGSKIKELIQDSKYSVKEISEKLGISSPNIYRLYERESMETKYLVKLSEIFNVPVGYFFSDKDSKSINQEIEDLKKQLATQSESLEFLKKENSMLSELRSNCEEKLTQKMKDYKVLDNFFEAVKLGKYGRMDETTSGKVYSFGQSLLRDGEIGAYRFVKKLGNDPELLMLIDHLFNNEEPPMAI